MPSLVSEEALTMLSVGQIPSQVGPRTEVQVAQSTLPNCRQTERAATQSERGRTDRKRNRKWNRKWTRD